MIEETQIGTDITKTNEQIQYDKQAKNLLSYACIEAWILKCLVSEFSDYAVQDICSMLTGKKQDGHLLDGETKLEMVKTEDTVVGQQTIRLDAYFKVRVPFTNHRIHINVELQKLPKVLGWLKKRGWYYIARMTTSQSYTVFEKDHYEKIEKVYSIWIVGGKRQKSRIERHTLKGEDGSLDAMELIIVYLGDPKDTSVSPIERLLNTIFSATLDIEEKKRIMQEDFFIAMNTDMERTVEDVCNLSKAILEMGRDEGREETKREDVMNLSNAGFSPERISHLLEVNIELVRDWIRNKLE